MACTLTRRMITILSRNLYPNALFAVADFKTERIQIRLFHFDKVLLMTTLHPHLCLHRLGIEKTMDFVHYPSDFNFSYNASVASA